MKLILSTTILLTLAAVTLLSRGQHNQSKTMHTSVKIDTVLQGDFSIRALVIEGSGLYYGADKSRVGYVNFATKEHKELQYDGRNLEFRSIARTGSNVFALNAGTPAILYRIDKNVQNAKVVYEDSNPKIFYDSMQFWDNLEGIAMGDPTESCLSILITRDGGRSWHKTHCSKLPPLLPGEAAFAASNTNIAIRGDKAWLATGGRKSRVFYSPDRGRTWRINDTPIIGGKAMTGIFSLDFYDNKIGFITGGDYEDQGNKFSNKALTIDGGITWQLVADGEAFGYASCVQFIPNREGQELVTVGPAGLYYSADAGATWKQMLADSTLYTIRFQNDRTAYAAGKGKIIRIKFLN